MIIKPPKPGLGFGIRDLGFWDLVWLGLGVAINFKFSDSPCDQLEQSVTIIPNLSANFRRKSLVNYAFPELHPEVL